MQPTYRTLFWVLALAGLALDQASKYGVFHWLGDVPEDRQAVLPGAFDLVTQHKLTDGGYVPHVNQGALFGMGQKGKEMANGTFAVISLLAAATIVWWSTHRSTARDRGLCFALGLILAGTLGNLYDRLVFGGVRDFLHWHYAVNWPVFNLADCCLVVGAGLLLLQAFRNQPAHEQESAAPKAVSVPTAEARYASATTEK